jgi:WXXGXW repeat (2 copies)
MKTHHELPNTSSVAASAQTSEEIRQICPPEEMGQGMRPKGQARRRRFLTSLLAGACMFGILSLGLLGTPAVASAIDFAVGVSVRVGPPPLPVYAQPVCPGPGYIWTPGYWAYDPANGYYWVPGTWVFPPEPGFLWTPGYWGWGGTAFIWHAGYWGPHVGFYGGIDYGFGYTGVGYSGGYWRGRNFYYNRSVNNINIRNVTYVYNRPVVEHDRMTRVSYNGGRGGITARPTRGELAAEHERHMEATQMQVRHRDVAHDNRAQFNSVNHGRPGFTATSRPGEFHNFNHNATPAGGSPHPFTNSHKSAPAIHPQGGHSERTAPQQFHPAPAPHNQATRGPEQSHPGHEGRSAERGKPSGQRPQGHEGHPGR